MNADKRIFKEYTMLCWSSFQLFDKLVQKISIQTNDSIRIIKHVLKIKLRFDQIKQNENKKNNKKQNLSQHVLYQFVSLR